MRFTSLLTIEFMKVKRSFIIPLIFIAPVVVIISGVSSLRMYLTPEYKDAWAAMFIQSCLLYAYYLLPFSMIVVCVLIAARESAHNGILKMLALPVSRRQLNLAKFVVVLFFLFLEMLIYLVVFLVAGLVTAHAAGVSQAIPVAYLLGKCTGLFFAMIPSVALMWLIAVVFNRPVLSIGINLLLVIPGILVANTPLWIFYPYCYGGYLIATAMADYQNNVRVSSLDLFPFLPCATGLGLAALYLSTVCFGKKEMR